MGQRLTQKEFDELVERKAEEKAKEIAKTIEDQQLASVVEAAVRKQLESHPGPAPFPLDQQSTNPRLTPKQIEAQKGLGFGMIGRAVAWARHNGGGLDGVCSIIKDWGNVQLADAVHNVTLKGQEAGNPVSGGFLVPEQYSQEVIEYLRNTSVVRRLGPRTMPMPVGSIRVPRVTQGTQASYIGESRNIAKTELQTGQLTLTWKKLAALVPISNDLLMFSAPSADMVVRDDVIAAMAERENKAFLRDRGTESSPKGIRYWAASSHVLNAASTVNHNNTALDLGKLVFTLKNANIPMMNCAWIMSPRTEIYLKTLQNTNGFYTYMEEMGRGMLWGYPYAVTTEMPNNLGTSNNESEIYFVEMHDACLGESSMLMVDSSSEAAYHDGTGVVSSYSQDQTVIRTIARHDFVMRRAESVAVLTGVTWGA